jgi:hypothetical protein
MVTLLPQRLLLLLLFVAVGQSNIDDEKFIVENQDEVLHHRRLQEHPYYDWFQQVTAAEEGERVSDAIKNGHWSNLTCPLGTYREFGNVGLRIPGGLRLDGCIPCPAGTFGNSTLLTHQNCTAPCPKGTYRPYPGGISIEDCFPCPRGTYGESEGLTTDQCSGSCSDLNTERVRFYGDSVGLDSKDKCRTCPPGYTNKQCHLGPFFSFLIDNSVLYSTGDFEKKSSFPEKVAYYRLYEKQRQRVTG